MIIGLGEDITEMNRFERMWPGQKDRFTEAELKRCGLSSEFIPCLCKRHAAKEAVMKALGTNDAKGNVRFDEIEITNTPSGRPVVKLYAGAMQQLKAITPPGYLASVWITISDDPPIAIATCIIEATPIPQPS